MNVESRLEELGIVLPPLGRPGGLYQPVVVSGMHAYVSGHVARDGAGEVVIGRVGRDFTEGEARALARAVGIEMLASLQAALGTLDRVRRVVKLLGMVNGAPGFVRHPQVIDGCSELFRDIWGSDLGVGARSAVGMGMLPADLPVEIEGIFEVSV
jgi:enamine deaminase RidA (YjgF/YER057c/UK114 family)